MMDQADTQPASSLLVLLRKHCWAAVLSDERMVDAICKLAADEVLGTNGAVRSLCAMYRQLRAGAGADQADKAGATRHDHRAAIARLIAAIAEADPDDLWLDRVIADMGSLQAGIHARLGSPLVSPGSAGLPDDPAFVAYLTAVRSTYFVLGMERRRAGGAASPRSGLPPS
jgi:hypothetical protein